MKKFIIILTFFTIISNGAFAQKEYSFGPKLGYSASTYDFNFAANQTRMRSGLTGGFYLRYIKDYKFIFETGAQITSKGTILEPVNGQSEVEFSATYLDMPLLIGFQPSKDFFQIKTGLQFSNLLSAYFLSAEQNIEASDTYRDWDISGVIELAYEFEFGLILAARFNSGITRLNRVDTFAPSNRNVDEWRSVNLQFTAAYNIPIYKRDF